MISYLAAEGIRSTVVSPVDGPLESRLEVCGAEVEILPSPALSSETEYEKGVEALTEWARGRHDAVVGASVTSFAAADVAARLGIPGIVRVGEAEPLRTVVRWLGGVIDPAVEERARAALGGADAVLFTSEAARLAYELDGVRCAGHVWSAGVDLEAVSRYAESADRFVVRRRLGVEDGDRLLVLAGSYWPVKGQHLAVDALAEIRRSHPRLRVTMLGLADPGYLAALGRRVEAAGLGRSIRLLPFCEDLSPWWLAADGVLTTSESESMPGSVVEAMSYGKPVVGAAAGGVTELAADDWLCDTSDVASLARSMAAFAEAPAEQLLARGSEAQALIRSKHDREVNLPWLVDLLRRLCGALSSPVGSLDLP